MEKLPNGIPSGKSLTIKGERRLYVICKRCGAHEVIVYRKKKGGAK